jgi:hypothetical protein
LIFRTLSTMATGVLLGGCCAFACAALSSLSGLLKFKGARGAPTVRARHPLQTARQLFAQPAFAGGFAVAFLAWALHVAALSLAPLSIVQVALASGMVMLAAFGERWFGVKVGGRRWGGLFALALALALLGISEPAIHGPHSRFSPPALIAFESCLFAVGGSLLLRPRLRPSHRQLHGIWLGGAAGILFSVSDTAIKALSGISLAHGPLALLASPWLAVAAAASVCAFYASAASLQQGEAIPVLAISGVALNVGGIVSGLLVFGDPLPGSALGILCQGCGYLLLVVASLLLPAPAGVAADAAVG